MGITSVTTSTGSLCRPIPPVPTGIPGTWDLLISSGESSLPADHRSTAVPTLCSYSTEVYFYSYFSGWGISEQLKWLQEDLSAASAGENRTQRPWIIAYGHRPMYCSNLDRDDCTTPKSVVRAGYVQLCMRNSDRAALLASLPSGWRHCSTKLVWILFWRLMSTAMRGSGQCIMKL